MKIPHTETSGTQDETENSENSSLAWRIESNEELITWNHWMKSLERNEKKLPLIMSQKKKHEPKEWKWKKIVNIQLLEWWLTGDEYPMFYLISLSKVIQRQRIITTQQLNIISRTRNNEFFVVGGEIGAGICLNEISNKIKRKNFPIFLEPTPPFSTNLFMLLSSSLL